MKQKLFLLIALFLALWQGAQAQTPSLVWQRDPDGRVTSKFSPDGKYIYGAGVPAIKIDAATGKTLLLYDSLKCTNSAIAISNGGSMIAGGGQEQTIHICDAATGKQIKALTASITYPNMIVFALAFSNDDKFLLACASFTDHSSPYKPPFTANGIFIWDLANDSLIKMIEDGSTTVAIAANNKYFATGSAEDGYKIYNINNNDFHNITSECSIKTTNISLSAYCRFSSDSKLLAYSDNFSDLKIYNIASQQGIEVNYLKNAYGFCFYNNEYLIYTHDGMTIQNVYNAKIILNNFSTGGNIEYNKASNKLFVVSGTSQKLFDMSGISSVDNNDTDYEVLYPNPANNSVNLDFNLEQTSNVKITLTDLKGNMIKLINDEVFEQGKHTISTSVSELSAGTYFINIITQSSSKYYKLIITN